MIRKLLLLAAVAALGASPVRRAAHGDDLAHVESKTLARLQEIAKGYEKLGRVDDEARYAPYLCRRPNPSPPRLSTEHEGKKIYFLYADQGNAYKDGKLDEVSFVVKESFEVADEATKKPGAKAGLFIMLRVGLEKASSDRGWVYATAKPDGTITSAGGAGMSCARCHRLAKNDHLFGLDGKKK
ncbi:MAG: hypothetical protein ACAI25_21290 [Planctomycetota bacterium]